MQRTRIVHIINSFEFGGAEAMLVNLLLRTDRSRFEPSVVALIDDLSVAQPIIDAGIPLAVMGMKAGIPDPRGVLRLAWHLQRAKPDVIQTWMDHSNLIGTLAAKLVTRAPIVWGIHHSNHVVGIAKRSTLMTVDACAMLSNLPARIICCSEHSRVMYADRGFAPHQMQVIPNGFDTSRFRPDPQARREVRQELGINDNTPLIGLVARFDPFKDHTNFLQAAARLRRQRPEVHFLMCGAGVEPSNETLMSQIRQLGLVDCCHLLGARRDVPRIHASLDLATSSSISEAFPLVLGEAMSCGVPCVSTNAGDSALIIGDTGRIVPTRDPAALAEAWLELLSLSAEERTAMGAAARRRVCEKFDLDAVTRQYHAVYEQLVDTRPQASRPRPLADVQRMPAAPSPAGLVAETV